MKYFQNSMKLSRLKLGFIALTVGVITSLSLGSCVEQDELLHNDWLDPSWEMGTYIDSNMTVRTSLFLTDSMNTSAVDAIFIGGINSQTFGSTRTSGFATYFPIGFDDETLFGTDPVLDSMSIALTFYGSVGDTNYAFNISVHEVIDTVFSYDNYYYSDFDPEGYYDPEPIFEFTVVGDDTTVTEWLPESFYSKLLMNDYDDTSNPYRDDTVFVETFKGFYFKVNNYPETGEQGNIRCLDFGYSSMQLYYHNSNDEPDTTYQSYQFYLAMLDDPAGNNFTIIDHDYSTADEAYGGLNLSEVGDTTVNTERAFLHGMCGIATRVEFDTLHIEALKAQALEMGYSALAVQRATSQWFVEGQQLGTPVSPETLDIACTEIGAYYDFETMSLICEYDPVSELLYSGYYYSSLNAVLNRSTSKYEMLISQTMQQLFNKPDDVTYKEYNKHVIEIMPSYTEMLSYNETVLGGGGSVDNQPLTVLVYTLVK